MNEYPQLCGGTFFTLVLQDLRQRVKAREHYKGERDGLSDPEVLMGLIRVINPDYQGPAPGTLKTKVNDFKSCKASSGQYLPFGNTAAIDEFDIRVQTDFVSARNAMVGFVDKFLEIGACDKRDIRLVKALVDLIQRDQSIGDEEVFCIGENGEKIKKVALCDLHKVCFQTFLLGVWHYAVVNRKDNTVGQNTYDVWCPSTGGGPRVYCGKMGMSLDYPDEIYLIGYQDAHEESEIIVDDDERTDEDEFETPPPKNQPTYGTQPLFVQQNGNGNTVIPNYGTMTINFGKH